MDSSDEIKPRQKRKNVEITSKEDPFGRTGKETEPKKRKLTPAQRTHERKISHISKKYKRGATVEIAVRCSDPYRS
jgi:hypothetical protein